MTHTCVDPLLIWLKGVLLWLGASEFSPLIFTKIDIGLHPNLAELRVVVLGKAA